jgi:hypothetical protein
LTEWAEEPLSDPMLDRRERRATIGIRDGGCNMGWGMDRAECPLRAGELKVAEDSSGSSAGGSCGSSMMGSDAGDCTSRAVLAIVGIM